MKRKRKIPPIEPARCIICGREFMRIANASRKRQYCDREKCQKIRKIKNSVAEGARAALRFSG